MVWGYQNDATTSLFVPVGASNRFLEEPLGRGQPITFLAGHHPAAFATEGSNLAWRLGDGAAFSNFAPACAVHQEPQGEVARIQGIDVPLTVDPAHALKDTIEATIPVDAATKTDPPTTVGSIGSGFQVSNDGAVNINIPFDLPAGVQGVQPTLSLAYGGGGANGMVGVGFSIAGFSQIARCAQSVASDGDAQPIRFTEDDRLCLDGDYLIPVGQTGNEYRAEHHPFDKIVSNGSDAAGPLGFTVYLRSGRIREYGGGSATVESHRIAYTASDSNLDEPTATDGGLVRYAWSIASERDRTGNAMTYEYVTQTTSTSVPPLGQFDPIVEHYPSQIRYTSTKSRAAMRSVRFAYEKRVDPEAHYVAGLKLATLTRLWHIDMYGPNPDAEALLWSYKFQYLDELQTPPLAQDPSLFSSEAARSRLARVYRCDQSGVCLKPTTFEWASQTNSFKDIDTHVLASDITYNAPQGQNHWAMLLGDVDGDGLDDLLYRRSDPQRSDQAYDVFRWVVALSLGDHFAPAFDAGLPEQKELWAHTVPLPRLIDVDMDGRVDVLMPIQGSQGQPQNACDEDDLDSPCDAPHWSLYQWTPGIATTNTGAGSPPRFVKVSPSPVATEETKGYFGHYDAQCTGSAFCVTWPEPLYVADLDGSAFPI